MQIQLNGVTTQVNEECSISEILGMQGLEGKRIAVEVNCEVIPRAHHVTFRLSSGDKVEIIQAVGGG